MKKILIVLILSAISVLSLSAENVVDFDNAELKWTVEGEKLVISFEAETKGWVAVGLGSSRMDGATIFIGYDKRGEAFFEEHQGAGHFHRKSAVQRPVEYELTETDGVTIMKFSIAKSDFVSQGMKELPVIVAYGARDNFSSMHRYYSRTVLEF